MPTIAATTPVQIEPSRAKTGGDRARTIVIFLVWQLLALLFVELILCWAGLGEEELFRLDPELGTRHMTNKRITWRSEGFGQCYLDADGMREPGLTIAKPAGTYRVALLGDSVVEGLQVPFEKTFGQILDKKLPPANGQKIQVLNFACSGYSTVQEYLQLKTQVLKYKPDLVLLCYNNRDMFENWSPPDQVLSNIRPLAVHLPGQKLMISNGAVLDWMRSPRARFMMQISWIREHSRIWGVFTAQEMEWSFHNTLYKTIMLFLNDPRKAMKQIGSSLFQPTASPSFQIKTFQDDKKLPIDKADAGQEAPSAGQSQFNSSAPNAVLEKNPLVQNSVKAAAGNSIYVQLVNRTMGSLIAEFQKTCAANSAKLAVIVVPCRATLCPDASAETAFFNITYPDEISIVSGICAKQHLPFFNCEAAAEALPLQQRQKLFYSAHFTPAGHAYMAETLLPFLEQQIEPRVYKRTAKINPPSQ